MDDTLRLILVGKTGSGKSATGNTILGKPVFESATRAISVTRNFQKEKCVRLNRDIEVLDTPHIYGEAPNIYLNENMSNAPHAILLVTQVGQTDETTADMIINMIKVFGVNIENYLVFVFTRSNDMFSNGMSPDLFIQQLPSSMRNIVSKRPCVFLDNESSISEKEERVQELLSAIEDMTRRNLPEHFLFRRQYYLRPRV